MLGHLKHEGETSSENSYDMYSSKDKNVNYYSQGSCKDKNVDSSISNNSKYKGNNSTSNSQTSIEYVQELRSETEAMDVIDPDL